MKHILRVKREEVKEKVILLIPQVLRVEVNDGRVLVLLGLDQRLLVVLVALLDFRDRDVRACAIFSWLTQLSFLLDLLLLVNVLVSLESVDEVLSIAHYA